MCEGKCLADACKLVLTDVLIAGSMNGNDICTDGIVSFVLEASVDAHQWLLLAVTIRQHFPAGVLPTDVLIDLAAVGLAMRLYVHLVAQLLQLLLTDPPIEIRFEMTAERRVAACVCRLGLLAVELLRLSMVGASCRRVGAGSV